MFCAASPIDTATPEEKQRLGFAASPIDTATWAQQNERGFAASPIDTATPEEEQRLRFCSFPHRHGDLGAAKQTSFCSFPHRHGDAKGKAETRDETRFCAASPIDTGTPEENQRLETRHVGAAKRVSCETSSNFDSFDTLCKQVGMSQSATPATQNDKTSCVETFEQERFCSFPHRHGINDATTTRRRPDEQLEANKGPAPPDYQREPFPTHSGKRQLLELAICHAAAKLCNAVVV